MIRRLAFEHLHVAEATPAEKRRAKEDCKEIIGLYGLLIDIFGIVHLFIAGCALAYIVILMFTSDFSLWIAFFSKLSLIADIFFYIFTFLIFIPNFVFVAILYQLHSTNMMAKGLLTMSAILLGVSLFLTTFSFPMSYMLKQSIKDYGPWYTSSLAEEGAKKLFYGTYKYLAVSRMALIIIACPIFSYFVSSIRKTTFEELYLTM